MVSVTPPTVNPTVSMPYPFAVTDSVPSSVVSTLPSSDPVMCVYSLPYATPSSMMNDSTSPKSPRSSRWMLSSEAISWLEVWTVTWTGDGGMYGCPFLSNHTT